MLKTMHNCYARSFGGVHFLHHGDLFFYNSSLCPKKYSQFQNKAYCLEFLVKNPTAIMAESPGSKGRESGSQQVPYRILKKGGVE